MNKEYICKVIGTVLFKNKWDSWHFVAYITVYKIKVLIYHDLLPTFLEYVVIIRVAMGQT